LAVRMNVDRGGRLRRLARRGGVERVPCEQRLRLDGLAIDDAINHKLVLPLQVEEHERLRRVEVDVTRLISKSAVRGDRLAIGQDAVLVAEDLERAGILWAVRAGPVAARDHYDHLVRRMHANLMRVNPAVERRGLRDFAAKRAVPMQIVHAQTAWMFL